jgi:hypothetical protein
MNTPSKELFSNPTLEIGRIVGTGYSFNRAKTVFDVPDGTSGHRTPGSAIRCRCDIPE